MQKPKLKFTIMFYVPGWSSEIIEGWGTPLNHIKNLCRYENDFLFYPMDGSAPRLVYKNELFENYNHAVTRLEREKKDHIEYHKKQVKESTRFLRDAGENINFN